MSDDAAPPELGALQTLAEVLPQFERSDLDDQLRTFDDLLVTMPPSSRKTVANLLRDAADRSIRLDCRVRILHAAKAIEFGRRATEAYDHKQAMEDYRRAHRAAFRRPWETDAMIAGEEHFEVVWKGKKQSVDSEEYAAFVRERTLYGDPCFEENRARNEEERWLNAEGRIVAAKLWWITKDDEGHGGSSYFICPD